MAKSIMPFNGANRCYTCQAICKTDEHHIFQGANRQASDKYGLTVELCRICHSRAHEYPEAFEDWKHLKQRAQQVAMSHYGWDIDEWRLHFRKDYL